MSCIGSASMIAESGIADHSTASGLTARFTKLSGDGQLLSEREFLLMRHFSHSEYGNSVRPDAKIWRAADTNEGYCQTRSTFNRTSEKSLRIHGGDESAAS